MEEARGSLRLAERSAPARSLRGGPETRGEAFGGWGGPLSRLFEEPPHRGNDSPPGIARRGKRARRSDDGDVPRASYQYYGEPSRAPRRAADAEVGLPRRRRKKRDP